jgi:hypothetical protein
MIAASTRDMRILCPSLWECHALRLRGAVDEGHLPTSHDVSFRPQTVSLDYCF